MIAIPPLNKIKVLQNIIEQIDHGIVDSVHSSQLDNEILMHTQNFKDVATCRKFAVESLRTANASPIDTEIKKQMKIVETTKTKMRGEIAQIITEKSIDQPADIQKICIKLATAIKTKEYKNAFTAKETNDEKVKNLIKYIIDEIRLYGKNFTQKKKIPDHLNYTLIIADTIISEFSMKFK